MSQEIEINEELVEEISERFCELKIKEYIPGQLQTTIGWTIGLVLSAVRDDKQKLPGEVGRAVWAKQGDEDHIYDWVADVIENGARTLIILRPEEEKETCQ